jgi:hypothetical protein
MTYSAHKNGDLNTGVAWPLSRIRNARPLNASIGNRPLLAHRAAWHWVHPIAKLLYAVATLADNTIATTAKIGLAGEPLTTMVSG